MNHNPYPKLVLVLISVADVRFITAGGPARQ